jgi:PAS domain S-box-containing protein
MWIQDLLRVVFDNCGDAVLVVNVDPKDVLDGAITYVNGAFCSLTGFARQEVEGKSARSFVWGEIPEIGRWKNSAACLETRVRVVLNFSCKNRSEAQVPTEAWLIRDTAGETDCIVFQQQAAWPRKLIPSKNVGDQTHACVFSTDLDGNVTSWNDGAVKATGFSADEMLGRDVRVLCTSPGSSCLPDNIIPILLKEGSFDFRLPLRRKDGGISHLAFALSLLRDGSGAPSGFLSVSVDITELTRHAKALQESSQLLEAIQSLQRRSMSGGDVQLVLGESLSMLLQMTNSEHGFCGEVRKDREGQPYIRTDTIQSSSKDPDTLRFFQPYLRNGFEFRKQNSLIGHVVKHGEAVVTNAPSLDPRSGGLPAGHPPLTSFAGLPLLTGQGVVGMVGLANRPGGYDGALLLRLQPLLDCSANIIEFCRTRDKASALAERFQHGFENTRDALVITGLDGKIVDWNPTAEKLFGYTRSEAVGRSFVETCEHWRHQNLSSVISVIQKEAYWENVIAFLGPTGVEITAEASGFPVAGDGDQLFMFVIRDITWRKQAEEALQEASCRFDAFIQNSSSAFWMMAADTKKLLYASPAFGAIAGLPPPSSTEQWRSMIHPDDYESYLANVATFYQGVSARYKYRIILADGRIRWVQSHAFPVRDAQGEIYRFAGLLEDVTEREEAVAKMRSALAEKEVLLKEIHHRVKNNLQIISSLLRLQAASTPDQNSIVALQESRTRVETIALLHEYLHQAENLSEIEFSTYIRRLTTKLMSTNQSSGEAVEVDFDLEPVTLDSQTTVLCGLILNELVSNSLRHAFPGGRKGKIRIRLRTVSGKAVMSIGDNGIGLPTGFDPQQVDTLGLRLVQRLARQLKGTFSISNGSGVNVQIQFPVRTTLNVRAQEPA